MKFHWIQHNLWLIAILVLAFLIRLPGISYGLPLHLYGDEEVNVYSALQMIEMHTALPVLHPQQFKILYEPPLLSYVYAVAFVPTIAVLYLAEGAPSLGHLADSVTLDPSLFWIVGRLINIFISLCSVYLIYRIGLYLFKEKTAALCGAFFFATSFIDVTLSATTRHWELGTSLSLLSLFLILQYANTPSRPQWLMWAGGVALGLSFGAGYLVYYLPFIGLLILLDTWSTTRAVTPALILPALRFTVAFAAVGLLMILLAPQPFIAQVIMHVSAGSHSLITVIIFYAVSLWNFETPLLLCSIIGLAALWLHKKYDLMLFFAVFILVMLLIMYLFLVDIERYLEPMLPLLSLVAGYGLFTLSRAFRNKKIILIVVGAMLCLYTGALYGRYAELAYRNDTKIEARNWVLAHIPSNADLIVDSQPVRLAGTPEAVAFMQKLDPAALRAADQALLRNPSYTDSFNSYNLYLVSSSTQQKVLDAILARNNPDTYVLTDSWSSTPVLQPYLEQAELVKTFSNGARGAIPQLLFIGGEAHSEVNVPVIDLLWRADYFGADMFIYRIKALR